MNDKTSQQKARQDSEELLVTSSTSSPSNPVETRTTTTSTPSSSPSSSSRVDPLQIAGNSSASPGISGRGSRSICPVVTSSTGNTSSNCTPNLEDEDDVDDDVDTIISAEDRIHSVGNISDDSSNNRIATAGGPPEMGGLPSQNDGDTCIVISTSGGNNNSSCLEGTSNTPRRNMLLTMRSSDSNNVAEASVSTVNSAVNVPSTPTTRSKRKLLNSDAIATGESSTTAATTLGVNRSSINLNYNKNVGLETKNHQSSTSKKKAVTNATLSSSINSSGHGSDLVKSKGGKNLATLKSCTEDIEDDSSRSSSSKRNCINTDESTESQSDHSQDVNIKCKREDSIEEAIADNRRVEPIKINLNRDVAKTKISIKSIGKQPGRESTETNEQLVIPKLTIKSSPGSDSSSSSSLSSVDLGSTSRNCIEQQSLQQDSESAHVVPKLIIRASDCNSSSFTNSESKHTLVPKLTIKVDNSMNCLKEGNEHESSASPSPSSSPSSGEQIQSQPPLPKLTIKTTGDTTESIISSSHSSLTSSATVLVSPPISSAQPTVPKLTIKTISKSSTSLVAGNSSDQSVPKLTIRTSASQLSPSQMTPSTDGGISDQENIRTNSPIPKFTIKTIQDPETNSMNQSVPRLKICTKQEEDSTGSPTILSPTVPKFTIKSVQENEQSIPKLTISVNDRTSESSSSSSSLSELVPKHAVVRHTDQDDRERVPKLTISFQESPKVKSSCSDYDSLSEKPEKLPKLTIKTVTEHDIEGSSEKSFPKLTIKTVATEESVVCEKTERVPKITIKAVPEQPSESLDKIPKLTIKTISTDPDGEEKSDKVPKITIKTKSSEESEPSLSDKGEKISKRTGKNSGDVGEAEKLPKITIKSTSEQVANTSTKFAQELADIPKLATKSTCESDVKERLPKLTIRQIVDTEESESPESTGRIPKITIKSVSESETVESIDLTQDEAAVVPKLKIKSHSIATSELESTTADKVPKLTIRTKSAPVTDSGEPVEKKPKLMVQQSTQNAEDSERIPKLTIKQITNNLDDCSSSSTSSTSSPKVPKLTINNHGTTGKHLKRAGRRKKMDTATEGETLSNDSTEGSFQSGAGETDKMARRNDEDTKPHTIQTRSSLRNSEKSDFQSSKKFSASKNGSLKGDEGASDKASAFGAAEAIEIGATSPAEKVVDHKSEHNSVESSRTLRSSDSKSEKKPPLELSSQTSSHKPSDSSREELNKEPAGDISIDVAHNIDSNLEMELERITSQSNSDFNISISDSNIDTNLEISADLSDAAINDLVDILNDDDLEDLESPIKNESDSCHQEEKGKVEETGKNDESIMVPEQQSDVKMDEEKTEDKSDIPDDVISLGSDENDIVDQLTELLNEADEANDFVDQLLADANGNATNDSSTDGDPAKDSGEGSSISTSEETMKKPNIEEKPSQDVSIVVERTAVTEGESKCIESAKPETETSILEAVVPISNNESNNTDVIKNTPNGLVDTMHDSSSNQSEKADDVAPNREKNVTNMEDSSLLERALTSSISSRTTNSSTTKMLEETKLITSDEQVVLDEGRVGDLVLENEVQNATEQPSDSNECERSLDNSKIENNSQLVNKGEVIDTESEDRPEDLKTSSCLKRHNVEEEVNVPMKRNRSDLFEDSSIEVSKLSSQVPIENCLDLGSVTPENSMQTAESKQSTSSNLVDLESSSLTGDETFRTLTELKTINNVDVENELNVEKLEGESSSLKGILSLLQAQDSSESLLPGNSECNLKSEASKLTEPGISVVTSTPPHVNSLKSTQSILLINEDTASGDCMITEEDPLMILPGSMDGSLGDGKDKVENDFCVPVEDIATPPVKRPRGRPRKDGKPAGSVRKGARTDPLSMRRRPRSTLIDGTDGTDGSPVIHRRKISDKEFLSTPNHIFTTPEPALMKTDPFSVPGATELPSMLSPATPARRGGRARGRGSRGGRVKTTPFTPSDLANGNTEGLVMSGRGRGRGMSIYRSRGRGRGRGSRGGRGGRGRGFARRLMSPENKRDGGFFSPDRRDIKYEPRTSSLQVFEEDTRMSAESFTPGNRHSHDASLNNNDENTQSSMMSSSSALDGSSNTTILNPTTGEKKKRAKMEVFAPEGKTEYTVDMICEYDWPPPKGCCPARNRDTFMIQEQIAQYLGIKSFKRKYPDLPRRQVDMEERNYLQEKGLVTEKMCDLGITAVWASDVLDIMYSDFYDKYEEYKAYLREKQLRDIEAKQRAQAADAVDKSLQARERALESASKWNSSFNKVRREERRLCLDLQNLVINLPAAVGKKLSRPNETQHRQPSCYPIALVPGQFAENYRVYSPEELRRYPINTILDPFDDRLRQYLKREDSDVDDSEESEVEEDSGSSSSSDSGSESSSDSDSSLSSSEDEDKPPDDSKHKCFVCHQLQNKNQKGFPELFIRCVTCGKQTHPSCIGMSSRMVMRVRNYNWQCADCKCCIKCKRKQDESKMLYCEQCDRGFHIYCIQIKNIPDGRWSCERCAICMRCGSTKPEGNLPPPPPQPNQKSSRKRVKWVNDYRIDPVTKLREHCSILCVPCGRLRTKSKTSTATTITTMQ